MKVKILQRDLAQHTRATTEALHPVMRNLDPALHPFEAGREYQRALNSTKVSRIFAKPFVFALDGKRPPVAAAGKAHAWSLGVLC